MSSVFDPSKGEPVEFRVEGEYWEKYKLEDDTVLYIRIIASKFIRSEMYDDSGQPLYGYSTQPLITTYAPKKNRGRPSPQPLSPKVSDHKVTSIDFERIGEEHWNIYKLSDGSIIRMRIDVGSVIKTDKFSADGDPYYLVNWTTLTRSKIASDLIRKSKK